MTITNLLKVYAKKNFTPLQINFLNNTGVTKSKNLLLNQSKFLHEEISIRLSHRVFDLLKLPYGIPLIDPVKNVIDLYSDSFERIQKKKVNSYEDVNNLSILLNDIKDKHNHLEDKISQGISILKDSLDNSLINYELINNELDKFFLSRISIRTLITQNNEIVNNNNSLIKNCNLNKIINDSVDNVNYICDNVYGYSQDIEVLSDKEIFFPYIPSHIYYILNEILKNSCVAHFKDCKNDEKITIEYSEGDKDIIIKISDNANSFPVDDLDQMMTYSYSSSPIEIIEEYEVGNKPIISGFGFGLPMARLYAKYFGGKLIINPMENKGTDVFIYINKLGNNPEVFI